MSLFSSSAAQLVQWFGFLCGCAQGHPSQLGELTLKQQLRHRCSKGTGWMTWQLTVQDMGLDLGTLTQQMKNWSQRSAFDLLEQQTKVDTRDCCDKRWGSMHPHCQQLASCFLFLLLPWRPEEHKLLRSRKIFGVLETQS